MDVRGKSLGKLDRCLLSLFILKSKQLSASCCHVTESFRMNLHPKLNYKALRQESNFGVQVVLPVF